LGAPATRAPSVGLSPARALIGADAASNAKKKTEPTTFVLVLLIVSPFVVVFVTANYKSDFDGCHRATVSERVPRIR